MKADKTNLILALNNAAALGILVFIVLLLVGDSINSHTPGISIGYASICFITELPLFHLSFARGWNKGNILSIKRLYLPTLSFICLFILSAIYTSIAYGYAPTDYFLTSDGNINFQQLVYHLKFTLIGVVLVFANQITGAMNEREIIINPVGKTLREGRLVTLHGHNKNDRLEIDSRSILYAESEGNYIKIIGKDKSYSIRMTLKEFQEAVKDFPELIRCHRAYIVNIKNACRFEGNSRKGYLFFNEGGLSIPVSQSYTGQITSIMKES